MARTKTVSMLELRRRVEAIVRDVQAGRAVVLTYRGRPVIRLEPLAPATVAAGDPFYSLADLAQRRGASLRNRQIDAILYGS
jgi:prevent-host-death family protein